MRSLQRLAYLLLLALVPLALADDTSSSKDPVKAVADHLLPVITAKGRGQLPVYISADGVRLDLSTPQPSIVRALLVFHGKLRDADVYNQSGLKAIQSAGDAGRGTLLITPQFLAQVDIDRYRLPSTVLRWAPEAWMGGDDALGVPISSFAAIDAILARLADRTIFPNLKTVVLAGHSGGGQVVQRYAVVGRGAEALTRNGVHVRYVIANPSSYVYFSPDRPVLRAKDEFTFAPPVKSCFGRYDDWKYGVHQPPPYVSGASFTSLEQEFLERDVRYLLGTKDTDPEHPALDKSCAAEDQGPFRFFRGKAYFRYLELRHPELEQPSASQQLWFVPGVEHDGDRMLNSACGLAALFDAGTCSTRALHPKPE